MCEKCGKKQRLGETTLALSSSLLSICLFHLLTPTQFLFLIVQFADLSQFEKVNKINPKLCVVKYEHNTSALNMLFWTLIRPLGLSDWKY